MDFEGRHEDKEGHDDQTDHSCDPMPDLIALGAVKDKVAIRRKRTYNRHPEISKFLPQIFDCVEAH
jgi:hypothetical protein